jgi:hypothetical protein
MTRQTFPVSGSSSAAFRSSVPSRIYASFSAGLVPELGFVFPTLPDALAEQ